MGLDFNFNFNLDDITLDKLYKDASNNTTTDFSFNKNVTPTSYDNSINKYGGISNSNVETLDLSSFGTNSKNNNISLGANAEKENSKIFDAKDNLNVNKNISKSNENINSNFKSNNGSISSNIENNGFSENESNSKLGKNLNEKQQSNISENLKNKQESNFSKKYETSTSNTSVSGMGSNSNNTSNNISNNTSSSIKSNNGTNKDNIFDSSQLNFDEVETDELGEFNNTVVTTNVESNISNVVSEVNVDNYINSLVKYGLRMDDINRVLNGEITLESLMIEIQNDTDTSRKKEIMEASYLSAYGLEISNMDELQLEIDNLKKELESLIKEKNNINDSREFESLMDIIVRLKNGENLDSILSSQVVAWKYTDENGNVTYRYDNPSATVVAESGKNYEPLYYEDMYKNSDILKNLKEVLTKSTTKSLFSNEKKDVYIWNGTEDQENFFKSLLEKYETNNSNRKEKLDELEENISKYQEQLSQYSNLYKTINNEVDYYLNYVDKYTSKEDFSLNSQSKIDVDSILERLSKSKNSITISDSFGGSISKTYVNEESDLVDVLMCMINDKSLGLSGSNGVVNLDSDNNILEDFKKWIPFLTENEVDIINYIYNTEGSSQVYQYLNDISKELDNRYVADKTQKDQEYASEHPVLASLASIIVTPIEGIGAACYSINSLIRDEKIRQTNSYSSGDVWRSQVASDIAQNYGNTLSFLYSTGMSMADSVSMIGVTVATGGVATPVISATLMGSRAYVSTLNDALDRGLSDGSAVGLAFSSAVVETAMESYSLGHLMNLETKLGESTSKLVLKVADKIPNETLANIATKTTYIASSAISQGLAEGEEEFATEILNFVFDDIISGDLSNHTLTINNYISLGYSEEEARQLANMDFANQLGQAFLGGFVSGICFGTFGGVKTTYNVSKNIAKDIENSYNLNSAKAFAEGIEINRIVEENALNQYKDEQKEQLLNLGNNIKNIFNQNKHSNYTSSNDHIQNIIININKAYEITSQNGSINTLISKAKGEYGKVAGVELFNMLGYNAKPTSIENEEFQKLSEESKYGVIVRGIAGPNSKEYANQLKNGEMYVGGEHASIKGTGIYTGFGLKSKKIGEEYSTRSGTELNGEIVEMILDSSANVVEYNTIVEEQNKVLDEMSKKYSKYSSDIKDFDTLFSNLNKITDVSELQHAKFITNFLADTGYYAALNGYDAIVDSKVNYLTVLNRGKLYVKEDKVNVLNLNNEEVEVIKVDSLDTSINEIDRYAVNLNTTYIGYDYVVNPKGDLNTILGQIINNNDGSKILIQLSNINDITLEMLEKVPDNINFRIIDYSMEFYQTFRKSRQNTVNAISEHLTYNVEELKLIIKEFDNIKNGIDKNWNNYQKARYIYNYMVNNIEYQKPFGIVGRNKHFDGLMSLVDKVSTCQGFAHTYSAILNNIGIKCFEVWGNMNGEGNHAYNIVSIDGNNFIVDTTRESINKSNPGKFEGTGFGVQNVEQYAAVSNVDLFNKLNSTYDTISQNLVQQNNYTNEINGTESVEELHEKLAKIAESGQPISLDFLENKSVEEIYDYIKENVSELNTLVQSKQIQKFIEKYYGEYPGQITDVIINNLSRENITQSIINKILSFNDKQFNEFIKYNTNSVLFENDEIFNRAISTGIDFIYGLDEEIQLKIIKNDQYISNIKNDVRRISRVASELNGENLELFLDRIGFDQFSISDKLKILKNIEWSNEIQLKIINDKEFILYFKELAKNDIYKLSTIFSNFSLNNLELLIDKLELNTFSVSTQFDIIIKLFELAKDSDVDFQKRIIDKSTIFDNANLINYFDFKKLIKNIKDKKFLFEIYSNDSVLMMLKNDWYRICEMIQYLDTTEQIQLMENTELLEEVLQNINLSNNKRKFNTFMESISSDYAELILNTYPKLSKILTATTLMQVYLKNANNKYLLNLKTLILNKNIDSYVKLSNLINDNNIWNLFAFEELDIIYDNYNDLSAIVDNIKKLDDGEYKNYFQNRLNNLIENKQEWNIDDLISVFDFVSSDQLKDIISKLNYVNFLKIKKHLNKFTKEQLNIIFDKIDISELLNNIENDDVYAYILRFLKNNPNALENVSTSQMPLYIFVSEVGVKRYNELVTLINPSDKLKFISEVTIDNDSFIEEMKNVIKNNPNLIENVPVISLGSFLNKFSLEDRLNLYSKLSIDSIILIYSNDLSIEEKNLLNKIIISNFDKIDSYSIIKLMEKMDESSQMTLINSINKFRCSSLNFNDLLKCVKNEEVLGLIFQKFDDKYGLDSNNLSQYFSNMNDKSLKIFKDNCRDDVLIRSFNILLSSDFESEILKRFDNNPRLFYNLPSDISLSYFSFLAETHFNNYINNYIYNNIKEIDFKSVKDLLEDITLVEKFNFIYAHQDGLFTKEKLEFLLNLKKKNKYVLSTFNYNLFDNTIYQLGHNLLTKLSKYYDVVDKIVELKNNPEKFNLFANMIVNDTSHSVLVQDQKMAMLLNYLLENDLDSSLLNYTSMNDVEIARNIILRYIDHFSIYNRIGVEIKRERSIIKPDKYELNNYYELLANKCDSLLKEATTVEDVQNLIFNKYFSICIEDAKEIFRVYGSKFFKIKNLDDREIATLYLENMYNILNADSMEEAIDLYNTFNSNYNMDETLTIINEIKQIYTKSLKNTLYVPTEPIGYVEYNGNKIPIYQPSGNFQMLVQSTKTDYGGMPMINNNYFDSWNLSSRTSNHGICCSLISNNNMGMANVIDNGILIGFYNFTDEQINMMAPYDIYTINDGYIIKCQRPLQFLPGRDVMNETRHVHNEFNLERTNLTGEGILTNIQPNYVLVLEEMDNEQKKNAYKASIEFNIPLVYLNLEALAINENNKIDNLISEFNTTYNVKLLKDILVLHENNRSGYRISKPNFVTQYFPSDKIIQILNDGIENAQNREDLLYIKEILEEENAKFDATYETTDRTNIIDIPIKELLEKIDDKFNLLNNNSTDLENLDNQVELINQILNFNDEQFKNFINTNTNINLYKNEQIFKRAMSTGMNFINRLYDITPRGKSFSNFSLGQLLENKGYFDTCEQLFKLVDNIDSLLILKGILYDGAIGNYSIRSNTSCKDNPDIESTRRVSMAYLFLDNPETFRALLDNNINVFHGTNGNALPNIINYGMNSVSEIQRRGINVTTGEYTFERSRRTDIISFTDVLDIAMDYSLISSVNSNPELDFNVIIGTSVDKFPEIQYIGSTVPEFVIRSHIDLEQIKCICVPNDKVEYVKKLLNNDKILVLGLSNYEDRFYDTDSGEYLYYDTYRFNNWIKNKFSNDNSKVKGLNTSNLDDIESNVQGAFNILTDKVNDVEFALKPKHENDTVRLISIKELLNIIKNDNMYDEFTTHKYFNRNTKYLVSDITRDEYLEAFVQLYHAIKNNSYSLGLTFFQNLRLKKIYNFALKSLDISKIQYDYSLPKEIKLNMMFNNKKIYNYKDLIILYNYYNENFSLNTLLTNPKLYVSDDYSFYSEVLNKYYNDNKKNLSNKDLTFWNTLIKTQMKLNDIILKNNIDLGEKGFNKFLSNITSWTKEVNDYVTYYGSIYGINIENLNYDLKMPDYLKLELMRRDKTIYDENLLINEMNKVISNNISTTIICDELYWLYYNTISKYYNNGNNKYENYYNLCEKIYVKSLAYIVDNKIDLSEEQFIILVKHLDNNINILKVQNYIASYLSKHSIDISEYLDKILYKETLPMEIKIQLYQKVLENADWYLRGNSNINYGVNQNSVALYMRFKINNLNWLDEENFKEYLIDKHNYKVEDADGLLEKIKERVGKSIDPRKGSLILEYIYEKCLSDNRFDVLDVVNNSFSFKFSDEFTRLALKLENLGMNELDSLRILSAIDSTGCCSYASVLNGIFMAYRNNPSAFERDFGYPMYIDVNGNKELNSGELMIDVYTFINSNKCGGSLFIYEDDGTLKINDLTTEKQIYITTVCRNDDVYHRDDLINAFLKFKNANSKYVADKSVYFGEGKVSNTHILAIKEAVTNFLMKVPTGSVELGLWQTKNHEFRLLNNKKEVYKTTNSWSEGAGHAVCITGVLDKYFIISSWGKRLFIPIEDFINNEFNIIFRHMEGIE